MNIISFAVPEAGSFLVNIILWLVKITGSVAAGVALFTLLLKLVTLPFDFISRFSMRKNSIKMEEMRPELEKLQVQYADNKDLYNQKMMALYKKNGYSMFGACLPTILTLVIFIVAINSFNDYSRYQNVKYFYDMSVSYNSVLYSGLDADGEYIKIDDGEKLVIDVQKIKDVYDSPSTEVESGAIKKIKPEGANHYIFIERTQIDHPESEGQPAYTENKYSLYTTNSFVYYDYYLRNEETNISSQSFRIRQEGLENENSPLASSVNNFLKIKTADGEKNFKAVSTGENVMTTEEFLLDIRQEKAAETFRNNDSSFLWVKNIWVTDSPMAHPIESFKDFNSKNGHREGGSCSCSGKINEVMPEGDYNYLTAKLSEQKSQPNGYFILVALTAGISLLTQIVMSKSQKAQMELQTVDGQGAQTQKMMTWMMPIMMAIFAFMYTAAFSIYIILSSFISMVTTIGINKIADKKFKKKDGESTITHSRVYVEKKQPEQDKKQKKDKSKGKDNKGDFLSGEAEKKNYIRGRLK